MEENLCGEYALSPRGRRRDDRCGMVLSPDAISSFLQPAHRLPTTVWAVSARIDDLAAPHRSPLWAARDVPLPRGDETTEIAPLGPIGRIVATIRLWRRRARSRQELRELNDHLLKDIGLSRDAVAYEVAKPFWR
jgi:uncharacterized protein YjiS (DUF1127 family)